MVLPSGLPMLDTKGIVNVNCQPPFAPMILAAFCSVPETFQDSISMNFAADMLPALFHLFHLKFVFSQHVGEVVVACPMRMIKLENNDGISPQKT